MHNSAARSDAAATALKSELVLRPLALPPAPLSSPPYLSFLVVSSTLSFSLLHLPFPSSVLTPFSPFSPFPPASFSRVARCSSVESRAVERFLGHYSRFSGLWTDETREGRSERAGRGKRENIYLAVPKRYYLLRSDGAAK